MNLVHLLQVEPAFFITKVNVIEQDEFQEEWYQVEKVEEYLLIVESLAVFEQSVCQLAEHMLLLAISTIYQIDFV
jgi:hypothetical protein